MHFTFFIKPASPKEGTPCILADTRGLLFMLFWYNPRAGDARNNDAVKIKIFYNNYNYYKFPAHYCNSMVFNIIKI